MQPKFGQVYQTKHDTYFAVGEVVTHNPQLILDNVNYIGKKNFVIHIKFGQGIARKALLMVRMVDGQLPDYLKQTNLSGFQEAVKNGDLQLLNIDADELQGYHFSEALEIEIQTTKDRPNCQYSRKHLAVGGRLLKTVTGKN